MKSKAHEEWCRKRKFTMVSSFLLTPVIEYDLWFRNVYKNLSKRQICQSKKVRVGNRIGEENKKQDVFQHEYEAISCTKHRIKVRHITYAYRRNIEEKTTRCVTFRFSNNDLLWVCQNKSELNSYIVHEPVSKQIAQIQVSIFNIKSRFPAVLTNYIVSFLEDNFVDSGPYNAEEDEYNFTTSNADDDEFA